MKPFEFQGKRLEAWTVAGTVLSTSQRTTTDINTSGGGGWIGPHGGTVAAPVITSSTTTTREIWLRGDDGQETAVTLVDVDVPLREGQRVTFIAARRPKASDGFWVTLVNDSAKRHWRLSSNVEIIRKGKLGAYRLVMWHDWIAAMAIFWFVMWAPLPRFMNPYSGGNSAMIALIVLLGAPVAYVATRGYLRMRQRSRTFAALDAWAALNAQAAYSTEKSPATQAGRTERVA